MKKLVDEDPVARGNPKLFNHKIVFCQMMTEAVTPQNIGIGITPEIENQFKGHAAYINNFKDVAVVGPVDGDMWCVLGFDELAYHLMRIIRDEANVMLYIGLPFFRTMVKKGLLALQWSS